MLDQRYRWKNKHLRMHVSILDGKTSPTILLKNALYLNQTFQKWLRANIWIYEDRIVYVGQNLPANLKNCEVIDCTNEILVPDTSNHMPIRFNYIIPLHSLRMHHSLGRPH